MLVRVYPANHLVLIKKKTNHRKTTRTEIPDLVVYMVLTHTIYHASPYRICQNTLFFLQQKKSPDLFLSLFIVTLWVMYHRHARARQGVYLFVQRKFRNKNIPLILYFFYVYRTKRLFIYFSLLEKMVADQRTLQLACVTFSKGYTFIFLHKTKTT